MHERSLMRRLLAQVRKIATDQHAGDVARIHLRLGVMSGVDPQLMASAFRAFTDDSMFEHAELIIDQVELEAECVACQHRFAVVNYRFSCPVCENQVRVIGGDTCELVSVSVFEKELK